MYTAVLRLSTVLAILLGLVITYFVVVGVTWEALTDDVGVVMNAITEEPADQQADNLPRATR